MGCTLEAAWSEEDRVRFRVICACIRRLDVNDPLTEGLGRSSMVCRQAAEGRRSRARQTDIGKDVRSASIGGQELCGFDDLNIRMNNRRVCI